MREMQETMMNGQARDADRVAVWKQRAVELAREKHTVGTAHYEGRRVDLQGAQYDWWTVPNEARTGDYGVRWYDGDALPHCSCVAGQYERPCKHAGALLYALAQRERATSPREAAQRERYQEVDF